ncbi:MAG TPA: hypothetical protein VKA45_14590 [Gaiellaceae bacterium]|nr:hypothetical protein [Gaiellaceae bacterium]
MEENARTLDLRPLLAVAAAVAVGLTLWASGAFAAGGSSSGDSPGGAQSFIQNGENDQALSREDCPKDRAGSGGGSGGSGGDSGSDAPSL